MNFAFRLEKAFEPYLVDIRDGLKEVSKGSKTSEKELKDLSNAFLYCLQPAMRSKIRVYSLDSDYDLDDTIFEAIIQGEQTNESSSFQSNRTVSARQSEAKNSKSSHQRFQLLDLAIDWDALDVAKEHIIKDDLSEIQVKTLFDVRFGMTTDL